MNINRMQEWLRRAATELGLRVEIGFTVGLPSGRSLASQALFPDLGGRSRGLLVFRWEDGLHSEGAEAAALRREVDRLGYATSIFGEPLPNEQFDLQNYAEMFKDWGWSGPPGMRPDWMANGADK